jgi:hypothetical protein
MQKAVAIVPALRLLVIASCMPVAPAPWLPAILFSSGVDIMVEEVLQNWPQKHPETVALVCIELEPTRLTAASAAAGRFVAEVLQNWPQKHPETVAFVNVVPELTRLTANSLDLASAGLKGVAAMHG